MISWTVSSPLIVANSSSRRLTPRSVVDSSSVRSFLTLSWSLLSSVSASNRVSSRCRGDVAPVGQSARYTDSAGDHPSRYRCPTHDLRSAPDRPNRSVARVAGPPREAHGYDLGRLAVPPNVGHPRVPPWRPAATPPDRVKGGADAPPFACPPSSVEPSGYPRCIGDVGDAPGHSRVECVLAALRGDHRLT